MEEIYLAGGCLWGVQEFVRHLPALLPQRQDAPMAARIRPNPRMTVTLNVCEPNSTLKRCQSRPCWGTFSRSSTYSVNKQGDDVGEKYRTGIYSEKAAHLDAARRFIIRCEDADRIAVEVLPLANFVPSDEEHQDRLSRFPGDYCHIPLDLLHKYKR